jgi:hypothetical protein
MGMVLSGSILALSALLIRIPRRYQNLILKTTVSALLIYKTIEYTLYGLFLDITKIPLEYSTLSYFIFSIAVLFNLKKMMPIASFMGFISGIGYLISFIFLADRYMEQNGFHVTMMAFINHSILFLGSMLVMNGISFHNVTRKSILTFTGIYVIYVIVINRFVSFTQPFIFIRMLLGGDLLVYLFGNQQISSYDYLLYFLILFFLYQIVIQLFLKLNHILYTIKQGDERHEYTI